MYRFNIKVYISEETGKKVCKWYQQPKDHGFVGYNDDFATIRLPKGDCVFINPETNQHISYWFQDAGCFGEGLAPIQKTNNKWGFIDKKGELSIPFEYDSIYLLSFNEGLVPVQMLNGNGKWVFIDKTGEPYIQIEFDDVIENFKDGKAKVKLNGEIFYINRNGNRITL